MATGLQSKLDFAGVAAAGLGAAAGSAVGGTRFAGSLGRVGGGALANTASALANAAARSVIDGTDFGDNILASLPDVIGQAVGGAVGEGVKDTLEKSRALKEATGLLKQAGYSDAAARRSAKDLLASPIANAGGKDDVQSTINALKQKRLLLDLIQGQAAATGADKTARFQTFKYRAELAILSTDVYLDKSYRVATGDYRRLEGGDVVSLTKGALTADRLVNGKSGYFSAIYVNEKTGELIYANRGSEGPGDLTADIEQARGKPTPQYEQAKRNAFDLQKAGVRVTFTGHSLGGGLATAQAVVSGYHALVFNPAGVRAETVKGYNLSRQDNLVTNVSVDGEALSLVQDNPRKTSAVVRALGSAARLILGPIAGRAVRQSIDRVADDIADAPRAGGRRITIEPGYAERNARTGQITGVSLYPVPAQAVNYHKTGEVLNALFADYLTGK